MVRLSRPILVSTFVVFCLILGFQNCSQSLPDDVNANQSSNVPPPVNPLAGLSASYFPNPAAPRSSVALSVTGGTSPYTISKVSGFGTFSGNTYTAPAIGETASFQVTDARGETITVPVYIISSAVELAVYRGYNSSIDGTDLKVGGRAYAFSATDLPAGFASEGIKFHLFQSQTDSDMRPVYLCRMVLYTNLQFMSADVNCEGQSRIGSAAYGYAFNSQVPGTVPLYRRRAVALGTIGHIMTLDPNEGGANFATDGAVGYVVH